MGGRGAYSQRKAFSAKFIEKGTKTAKQKAAAGGGTVERREGTFGGNSDTGRATDAQMKAEFANWRNGLTKDQASAFYAYTNGEYSVMNGHMRGKFDGGSTIKEKVKNLNASFNHTLSRDVTVYRGTGFSDNKMFAEATTVGGIFRDKGAFSTSLSRNFAKNWASYKNNKVVYTVRLPKGYKGAAYVASISPHKHEREVLLKPGTNFRVVRKLKSLGSTPHYLITPV